ncbi:unnamed protein product [Gongylonema pulchrum]|uniref:Ovule protein n=1 Tax=Gongylonema pulchrum TaxID=637853 RepID=A0A183DMQ0_9BILA|nr:unnamed protein product [Gongylonema pulchrum]
MPSFAPTQKSTSYKIVKSDRSVATILVTQEDSPTSQLSSAVEFSYETQMQKRMKQFVNYVSFLRAKCCFLLNFLLHYPGQMIRAAVHS